MTEATGSANPSEVVGTPWEDKWNGIKKEVVSTKDAIVDTMVAPWERIWSQAKPTPPKSSGKTPDKFEQVFNKLINTESGGQHTNDSGSLTTSPVGAKGITQVMPATGDDPGYGVIPIKNNTEREYKRFGKDYLRAMLKEFDGDYEKALAAYNHGVGNVKKAIDAKGAAWKDKLPPETTAYLDKILGKK